MSGELFHWLSDPEKHWSTKSLSWLAVRFDLFEQIQSVHLQEGDHHYFESFHILDLNGQQLAQKRLPGAQPVNIWTSEQYEPSTGMSFLVPNLAGRVLLVKTRFLNYTAQPFDRRSQRAEVQCGSIVLPMEKKPTPILMHVNGNAAMLDVPQVPPNAQTALEEILLMTATIALVRVEDNAAVRLEYELKYHTDIYFLVDEELPAEVIPGNRINPEIIRSTHPPLRVARRKHSPNGTAPPAWKMALPVMIESPGVGIVGQPLLREPFKLLIGRVGPEVRAIWDWVAPRSWLSVKILWFTITGDGTKSSIQTEPVFRQGMQQRGSVGIYNCGPSDRGKRLRVRLIPMLLRTPIKEPEHIEEITL